jgi:uncharacterized protein with beta-barrel porin domain
MRRTAAARRRHRDATWQGGRIAGECRRACAVAPDWARISRRRSVVAGIGAVLHAGVVTFEPRIGLDYDHNDQHGFTETGGGAAKSPHRRRGARRAPQQCRNPASRHLRFRLGPSLMPEFSIAWAHNLIDPAVTLKEQFVAAKNASFRIEGEEPPEDFLLLGVGLSFHPNASDEISCAITAPGPRTFRPM